MGQSWRIANRLGALPEIAFHPHSLDHCRCLVEELSPVLHEVLLRKLTDLLRAVVAHLEPSITELFLNRVPRSQTRDRENPADHTCSELCFVYALLSLCHC